MGKFCIFLLLLVSTYSVLAQSESYPYNYNWQENKTELIISSAFWMSSHYIDHLTKNDGIENLDELNVKNLWSVDKNAVQQNSSSAEHWSDYTLYASIALPFLTSKKSNGNGVSIALMGLQGFFIENGINKYVKTIAERPRPYVYREGAAWVNQVPSANSERSFYSGHTSGSAYFCFFAARTFTDLHPDSKWEPYIWATAITLPAVTGYLRYRAGKHFPTDVAVGYVAGAFIGNYLPKIYRNRNIKISGTSNGFALHARF